MFLESLVIQFVEDGEVLQSKFSTIVVANTNTSKKELNPYYYLATTYGYKVFSIIVESRHNGRNIHNVSEEAIQRMKNKFEIQL